MGLQRRVMRPPGPRREPERGLHARPVPETGGTFGSCGPGPTILTAAIIRRVFNGTSNLAPNSSSGAVFDDGMSAILVGPGGVASHMEKRVASAAKLSFLGGKGSNGGPDRRSLIANAMDSCIRDKGYAATTLTDIAVEAGMSPSHIRYYFDGKEEILEFFLEAICEEIMQGISAIARRTPAQWLDDFTAYFFTNPALTRDALAVLVEVFAAAVHKVKHDDFVRKTFVEFFRWAGCAEGISLADAAYTAAALDSGLKFNAVFQKDFVREKAAKTFLGEMRRMAGLHAAKR